MRDKIEEALKQSKADYTEIRIEDKETSRVAFRGRDLETANANIDKGGMVRCLIRNKGWGVATFNDLDDLVAMVDQAYQCARVGTVPEPIELTPAEPVESVTTAMLGRDFRDVPLSAKKALAERYNQILLGHNDRIVDTQSIYSDAFTHLILANSEGTYIEQDKPSVVIGAFATARDGDNVQQANEVFSSTQGYEYVLDKDELVRKAAVRAVELLGARPVQAGQYPVVIDQLLAGVFIHEAFGHLSEADFVYENPKARKMMTLGRRFGQDILNVYDDGSIRNLRGTTLYDDEGTPARRNWLIQEWRAGRALALPPDSGQDGRDSLRQRARRQLPLRSHRANDQHGHRQRDGHFRGHDQGYQARHLRLRRLRWRDSTGKFLLQLRLRLHDPRR